MLVDNKRGILQIKARLGRPRAGRTQEPIYKIHPPDSIAGWVAQNKRPYTCPDVSEDKFFAASRSGKNFKSLLSVPIVHKGKILAVINADSNKKEYFTGSHLAALKEVARQSSKPIADRISIADALSQIGVELTRLPKRGGVDSVLSKIADLALRALGADIITLYQYNQEKDVFLVEGRGPTVAGEIRVPGPMRRKVYPGDVPWTVVKQRKSGFYPDVEAQEFLQQDVERPGETPRPRFIQREGIKSMAALLLPHRAAEVEEEEVVGVMFASYRTRHEFDIDERMALATFADYASVAILNARVEEHHYTEQMRMVEAMSANFAHRMGNLAGVSRVASKTLRERINPNDEISFRQLTLIEQRADVLLELAERLSRPFKETGHMFELKPINLCDLVDEELKQIGSSSVEIRCDLVQVRALPPVMSVRFQLRQVLHDLLSNAIEALRDRQAPKLEIRASCNSNTRKVEVEIIDNGSGISDSVRERLFSPGVTTKKEKLGIGLWWSRSFMQATGGNLILKHTEPDKGTTFLIEIPCSDDYKGSAPLMAFTQKEILIVDDDTTWLQAVVDNLSLDKFEIVTATSYSEAAELLANSVFKVALLDLRLVDADPNNVGGLHLLEKISASGANTKVIMLTHFGSDEHEQIARQSSNVLAFYRKREINMKSLRDTLKKIIAGRRNQTSNFPQK